MQQLKTYQADDEVQRMLYDRFAGRILLYLCRQVTSRQDAEDLLLDVFLAALKSEALLMLDEKRQLAWLLRVARNKVIDRYRHSAVITFLPLEGALHIEDDQVGPEQHIIRQESYARLYQALAQLSLAQQKLIYLRYEQGLRLVEIARRLDRPQGSVRKLLARTLRKLRMLYDTVEGDIACEITR